MGNWIIAVVLAFAATVGLTVASQSERSQQEVRTSYAQSLAGNMQIYRNSVVTYAQAHTASSGPVSDTSLSLPAWFNRNSDIKNYISGGLGYVYVNVQNDGQARELLESTNNDVLVGIKRGGVLYNSIAGTTAIALPSQIPEGAVVFAPSALSGAAPIPAGPTPPANCAVAAGTARSWTVGSNSCSAMVASSSTVPHLAALTFTDAAPGTTGTAQFYCVNGALQTTPGGSPTCNPPPPCNVAAGTTRNWTVGGAACGGPHAAATVASGASLTFTSTNGNDGAAGFRCNAGTLSSTPDGSQTCVVPPAPCVLPSPSSQTNTETRTASQTIAGCPAGYAGTVNQTRPEKRTQTRTAYCPAPTGAYSWGVWSAWSTWSATASWTTASSSCTKCPASSTQTQNDWEPRSAACPSGQSGSHTWEEVRTRSRSVSYSCPAGTTSIPAPTYGTYSAWSWTGTRRNEVNTCKPAGHYDWMDRGWTSWTVSSCPAGSVTSYSQERTDRYNAFIKANVCDASNLGLRYRSDYCGSVLIGYGLEQGYGMSECVFTPEGMCWTYYPEDLVPDPLILTPRLVPISPTAKCAYY